VNGDVVTRWPVVREESVRPEDLDPSGRLTRATLERWVDDALAEYLGRCPRLRAELDGGARRLRRSEAAFDRPQSSTAGSGVLLALGVCEIRPSSIDVAVRIRALASDDPSVANGRVVLVLVDGTGTTVSLPAFIEPEIIAVEAAASRYC
jgi:acyl-CoA thioesterase FadM